MITQYLPILLEKEGDYLFEYKDGIVNMVVYENGLVGIYNSNFEKYYQIDVVVENCLRIEYCLLNSNIRG